MSAARDPFRGKWRRFRQLAPEDRGLVLRGTALLSLTMLGLRTMNFRRCKELIQQFSLPCSPPQRIEANRQLERGRKIVSAMHAVEGNSPWRPNCLERSLALWWFLRLDHIEGELHIGARKEESRFEAHAWVEWNGYVVNDSPDIHEHYARFDAPIAAAEADFR
jgi:hypothetical protein